MCMHTPTHSSQVKTKHIDISKLNALHFCIYYTYCNSMLVIVGIGRAFLTTVRQFLMELRSKTDILPIDMCWQSEKYSCFMKYLHKFTIKEIFQWQSKLFVNPKCANSYIFHGLIWNFVDICTLGFPCTLSIAHNFNSLNTT